MLPIPALFRIETDRLVLDNLSIGDEQRVFEWASDPIATRFMAWQRHETLETTRGFVARAASQSKSGTLPDLAIAIRRKSDRLLLGTTGIHPHDSKVVETGYILHRDSWGNGYATEAVRAVIEWVFCNLPGVHEVIAPIFAENLASQHLARRVGMTFRNEERHNLPRGDTGVRILVYSVRRESKP